MKEFENGPIERMIFGKMVNVQDMMYAFIALPIFCFLLYGSHLPIQYFGDDFGLVFDKPWDKLWYFFNHKAPHGNFYRPIEASLLAFVQTFWGLNTYPIHFFQIFMHSLLCGLVYWAMLYLGFSRKKAIIGSFFLVVSQANVIAVLSNDTVSQVMGTLFGCTSVFLVYYTLREGTIQSLAPFKLFTQGGTYWLSVLALTIALFSKESSMAFIVLILGMVTYFQLKEQRSFASFRTVCVVSLPYLSVTLGYLILRSQVVTTPPSLGSGAYNFHVGLNVIENFGRFIFASATPISTATIFSAWNEGNVLLVIAAILATMVFLLLLPVLLWKNAKWEILVGVLGCGIIALFPMVFLNHVSELHVYNALPFFSILFGVAVGSLIEKYWSTKFARGAIGIVLPIFIISHIVAVNSKALLMKGNGERAQELLLQIDSFAKLVPPGGRMCFVNPPTNGARYSIFHMKGFDVIKADGRRRIHQLAGRKDFSVKIVDQSSMTRGIQRSCFTLTVLGNKVVKWDGEPGSLG